MLLLAQALTNSGVIASKESLIPYSTSNSSWLTRALSLSLLYFRLH